MSKFKFCIVQYYAWQVDRRKKKKLFECKDCPIREKCNKENKQ